MKHLTVIVIIIVLLLVIGFGLTGCTYTKEHVGLVSHITYNESLVGSGTTVYFDDGTSVRFRGKTDNIVVGERYRLTIKITPTDEELIRIDKLGGRRDD